MTGYFLSAVLGVWASGIDVQSPKPWVALFAQATPAAAEEANEPPDAKTDDEQPRRGPPEAGRGGRGRRGPFGPAFGGADRGRAPRDRRADAGDRGGRGRGPGSAAERGGRETGEARRGPERPGFRGWPGPRPGFGPQRRAFAERPWERADRAGRPDRPPAAGRGGARGEGDRRPPMPPWFAQPRRGGNLFEQLDRNGDQSISREEFNRGMARLIGFPVRPEPPRRPRD
jgi:hypothetical protein